MIAATKGVALAKGGVKAAVTLKYMSSLISTKTSFRLHQIEFTCLLIYMRYVRYAR